MIAKPHRKLTITVEDAVYRGLRKVVGPRNISRFLNDLARPHVVQERLEEGYRAMAADEEREAEAALWSDGLVGDVADEPR
ncbi:MAG: addiction module antitoxin [Candidatus Binataceae bacterium]